MFVDYRDKAVQPKRHQNIANSLRTANSVKSAAKSPKKSPQKAKKMAEKLPIASSSSFVNVNKGKAKGTIPMFARIQISGDPKSRENEITFPGDRKSLHPDNLLVGNSMRNNYQTAARGESVKHDDGAVRYFDATIPKSEIKYVAPDGLAVKETSDSPNAWEKGRKTTDENAWKEREKAAKNEEMEKKIAERGQLALKKAKLEKEMTAVKAELLKGIDFEHVRRGRHTGVLGLDEDVVDESGDVDSSDDFLAVETDEEYSFPSPHTTVKKYSVKELSTSAQDSIAQAHKVSETSGRGKSYVEKKRQQVFHSDINAGESANSTEISTNFSSDYHSVPDVTTAQRKRKSSEESDRQKVEKPVQTEKHGKKTSKKVNPKIPATIPDYEDSADEFLAVETDEEYTFPSPRPTQPNKSEEPKSTSVQDLLAQAKKVRKKNGQDKRKREKDKHTSSETHASSVSAVDHSMESSSKSDAKPSAQKTRPDKMANQQNLTKPKLPTARNLEKKLEVIKSNVSKQSSSSSSSSSSDLVNVKIQQELSSYESNSNSQIHGREHSSSGDNSSLLHLKLIENTAETTSSTDKSSASTTDYYSPPGGSYTSTPDGPFTSTPDGKLLHKGFDRNSLRKRALKHYVDKFLQRRPSSIESLPVSSSSSSSVLKVDSDVFDTESFLATNLHESSSQSSTSLSKDLSTLHEEALSKTDSGSTIAATAVVARRLNRSSSSSHESSNGISGSFSTQSSDSPSQSNIHSDQPSSESLAGLLKVLSNHQVVENNQNEQDESLLSSIANFQFQRERNDGTLESSGASIPDVSAILHRLRSRQPAFPPGNSARTTSSASSSSKSGPDVETKRIVTLDDESPTKLWETPPMSHFETNNDTEKVTAVFESLKEKFSQIRIEKPVW